MDGTIEAPARIPATGTGLTRAEAKRRLLAGGLITVFFVYLFINIAMVMGLLPVVGIPLPLISYVGTAIVTVMVGFGLLMAVHLNRANDMTLRGLL